MREHTKPRDDGTRAPRRRRARLRAATALLVALLSVGACAAPAGSSPGPYGSAGDDGPVRVAYGDATAWLATLSPAEAGQQLLDWARVGLASALGARRDELVDQLYDSSPLRSEALDDLAEQPVAPGRALRVGDTLHLIVAADDPAPTETLAELLDQYRADHGADAPRTQVHDYRADPRTREVTLTPRPAAPTASVRAEAGWVEQPVDDPAALAGFLARADRFSGLGVRDGRLWASGWDEPGRAPDVTPDDVAVLAAGYGPGHDVAPGFSLDPGPGDTPADLAAALPGLSPGLVALAGGGSAAGSGFASRAALSDALDRSLFDGAPPAPGLPADRTGQWALRNHLDGAPLYSQARYDGGIAGSEVGMTLFYADYVAKDWVGGVGTGVPSQAVPGFVPDPQARTPAGLCPAGGGPTRAAGRLWFGQNDAAFAYDPAGVTIGAQATRLYFRAEGGAGTEVQPDYRFGRGLSWWDRNYRAVADYEPQYRRLEQIMRWSGALEWLSLQGRSLPTAPPAPAPARSFASWYAAHPELRERAALHPVQPPSATAEAVLTVPSTAFDDCGAREIVGGVSLADVAARRGGLPPSVPLPGELARARPADPGSTATGIHRDDPAVDYRLARSPAEDRITIAGGADPAVALGGGRVLADTGHAATLTWRGGPADPSAQFRLDDQTIAQLRTTRSEDATGGTRIGIAVRSALSSITSMISGATRNPDLALAGVPDLRFAVRDPAGGLTGYADGTWLRAGPPSPGFAEALALEVVAADGRPVHLAVGRPRQAEAVAPGQPADLTTGPARRTTLGEVAAAYPAGTAFFTDPTIVIGTTDAQTPVTERELVPAAAPVVAPGTLGTSGTVAQRDVTVAGAGASPGVLAAAVGGTGPGAPTVPGVFVTAVNCTTTTPAPAPATAAPSDCSS